MPHPKYARVPRIKKDHDELSSQTHHKVAGVFAKIFLLVVIALAVPFFIALASGIFSLGLLGNATSSIKTAGLLTPSPFLQKRALQFVSERENAYREAGQHKRWKLRGHGYLYAYHNISLAARVMPATGNLPQGKDNMSAGLNRVRIWNVHPARSDHFDQCHLLSIWVRVMGPEIIAGLAHSILAQDGRDCLWEFLFDIQIPGSYQVDAKLIFWNGNAPVSMFVDGGQAISERQCPDTVIQSNELSAEAVHNAPKMTSIMGFKLYQSIGACCEICRRTPHCLYWATPTTSMPVPTHAQNGCDLYFAADAPDDAIPTTRVLDRVAADQRAAMKEREAAGTPPPPLPSKAWGPSYEKGYLNRGRNNRTAHFLGCGWSFWFMIEFPCLDGGLDDHIYMERRKFNVVADEAKSGIEKPQNLPWCIQQDELFVVHNKIEPSPFNIIPKQAGRWVREPWPTHAQCPEPMELHPMSYETSTMKAFPMEKIDGSRPHCWHRSDLTNLSRQCWEENCEFIEPHHLWEETTLQHEANFMGVWRNYHCNYMEYNNNQLSDCLKHQKISKLITYGASIARNMRYYFGIRTENLTFYNETLPDAREVVVFSMQWPHLIWHMNESQYRDELDKSFPPILNTSKRLGIAVSPFLVTSEREQYMHLERAIRFAQVSEEILMQKGYLMINAFDLSAAFPYDTSTQSDGLHIVGPPIKIIVMKVFHHLCMNVVEGTIL